MPFRCDMRFEKGKKKFGKRRARTRVDRVKKHTPYHLLHWNDVKQESFFSVGYPNHTLIGGVSVNSLCQQGRCQGSVVCVICSCLLCPYLVCFLSSSDVIISLFLSSRACLIVYDYPLYISPVFWVWFRLVYSLLPGISCLWVLPCCH